MLNVNVIVFRENKTIFMSEVGEWEEANEGNLQLHILYSGTVRCP